jgi:hypothetical protein
MDAALTLFSPRLQERDRLAQRLAGWLSGSPVWTRFGARRRHFVVLGRTTWDFARSPGSGSGWGTSFSSLPDFARLSKLLIERNAWRPDELAVPYPTSFHPSSDADVELWLVHSSNLLSDSCIPCVRSAFDAFFAFVCLASCIGGTGG